MYISIEIRFVANGNNVLQRGDFPVRGKKHEEVALEWWKQIKKDMPVVDTLIQVLINGEDITDKVKEMEYF